MMDFAATLLGRKEFQWAPTLGGECYYGGFVPLKPDWDGGFNGHPPLGVNATVWICYDELVYEISEFQWAPTLGGECYNK